MRTWYIFQFFSDGSMLCFFTYFEHWKLDNPGVCYTVWKIDLIMHMIACHPKYTKSEQKALWAISLTCLWQILQKYRRRERSSSLRKVLLLFYCYVLCSQSLFFSLLWHVISITRISALHDQHCHPLWKAQTGIAWPTQQATNQLPCKGFMSTPASTPDQSLVGKI